MQAVEKLENPQGFRLRIFLQPKASLDQIVGLHNNELTNLKLRSPLHLLMVQLTLICSNI